MAVAVFVSNLAAQTRSEVFIARRRAKVTAELYSFSQKLAGIIDMDDLLWATAHQIASMLKVHVVILLPEKDGVVVRADRARRRLDARRLERIHELLEALPFDAAQHMIKRDVGAIEKQLAGVLALLPDLDVRAGRQAHEKGEAREAVWEGDLWSGGWHGRETVPQRKKTKSLTNSQ